MPGRETLVAAARRAFTDLGADAGLADIATHAGLRPDAFDAHFISRDDLVAAVIDDLMGSFADESAPPPRSRPRRTLVPLAAVAAVLPIASAPVAPAAAVAPAPHVEQHAAVAPASTQRVLTLSPLWQVSPLRYALQGTLCQSGTCDVVPYLPFSMLAGLSMLSDRLAVTAEARIAPPPETIVFGYSHGALVASQWLGAHADDPHAPSPDELSFVFIGNPTRAHGGRLPAMPQSPYRVLDIVRQYDPVADFPDNPFNLLALINVAAGALSPVHLDYTGVDLDDPANTVWTEGNTTYVFVPTHNLPLLSPLRLIGLGWLADALNEPVKAVIEQAYDRPYLAEPEPAPEPAPAEPEPMPAEPDTIESRLSTTHSGVLFADAVADADATEPAALSDEQPPKSEPATEDVEVSAADTRRDGHDRRTTRRAELRARR